MKRFLPSLFNKSCLNIQEDVLVIFWRYLNWLKSYAVLNFSASFTSPPCIYRVSIKFWNRKILCSNRKACKKLKILHDIKSFISYTLRQNGLLPRKKRNSNFKHSPRNYMPSGSQNMFWINTARLSEREIDIWSSSLFTEMSIFQLEKLATKTLQIDLYLL